jgi:hypothetical protein
LTIDPAVAPDTVPGMCTFVGRINIELINGASFILPSTADCIVQGSYLSISNHITSSTAPINSFANYGKVLVLSDAALVLTHSVNSDYFFGSVVNAGNITAVGTGEVRLHATYSLSLMPTSVLQVGSTGSLSLALATGVTDMRGVFKVDGTLKLYDASTFNFGPGISLFQVAEICTIFTPPPLFA